MCKYEEIKNYLLKYINEVGDIVCEINSINNSLDYLEYWDNDEEFFDSFFHSNPMEAVRSSFYGDYNYCDEYVKFDGYGNLKSVNEYELEKEYKDNIDEIIKELLEHYEEMYICDDTLKNLIEEYKNMEVKEYE